MLVSFTCAKDEKKSSTKIHYLSMALLIVAYYLVVYAFNKIHVWDFSSWKFFVSLLLSILIFIAVVVWQKVLPYPLFKLSIFQYNIYRGVSLTRPLFQFNFGAFFFISPLYIKKYTSAYVWGKWTCYFNYDASYRD